MTEEKKRRGAAVKSAHSEDAAAIEKVDIVQNGSADIELSLLDGKEAMDEFDNAAKQMEIERSTNLKPQGVSKGSKKKKKTSMSKEASGKLDLSAALKKGNGKGKGLKKKI